MKVRIEAHDLRIAYQDFVAVNIDAMQLNGNIFAILGHNGAGKSTFIKSLLGLLVPARGTLSATQCGDQTATLLQPHLHMAFCPETGSVFEDISVEDYVRLWCRIKHRDGRYFRTHGREYIELLELEPLMKKLGRELSKGQRRRVQTAIGFLTEPRLFLFDEPFDGLDVQKTTELTQIIRQFSDRMCFLVSSHRMDVVERLADQVMVLQHGTLAAAGNIEQVSEDLAQKSVMISHMRDCDALLRVLAQEVKECSVTRIGNQLSVTGEQVDIEILKRLVEQHDKNGASLEYVRPSLTDAMNHHLKKVR